MKYKIASDSTKYCEFYYTNDIGRPKKIQVFEKKDNKYPITLWDMLHGEWAGNGHMTSEQLNEFFKHYNIRKEV